ncbi:MAG: hypothetical protein ACKVGZ_11310 [Alphaproteobacteria bacterium]|jgi:hypothetical protein
MARGFRESRRRDRSKRRLAVLKWVFLILGLLGLGFMAYAAGTELARGQVREMKEKVEVLEADLSSITSRAAALQTERDEAVKREEALKEQVPTGKAREIFALLSKQLKAGVKEERLMFLVRSSGEAVRCRNEPVLKRFLVQTGLTRAKNDWVTFAKSAIVVRAKGEVARNAAGQPHAWFDQQKPITVSFTKINGGKSEATGLIPLQHSVVLGGDEYRFVITPAKARGFLQITADRCQVPR